MSSVSVHRTAVFEVFCKDEDDDQSSSLPLAKIDCDGVLSKKGFGQLNELKKLFKAKVERNGYSVLQDVFDDIFLRRARKQIVQSFFEKKLLPTYDLVNDEFDGFDMEENCITRMPRIGNGKHNIHFDPEFSPEHKALNDLVSNSPVLKLLSHYMGFECSLRESGLSVTRPKSSVEFAEKHPLRK